ncbi:triose-phosphate transporter family-domain-containing protein [Thelonectria olida]|uniref:Triose-phosphate transporter family-domain-containing protein n=1 Tax=Thelonectria olida TaxID=1576542 RepID=A0A9P9AGZ3_9HYPO|nr:triose-phosphate transporter family-domain-containing protein [Thelonectria olida]
MEKLEKFPDFIDPPSHIISRSPSPLRAAPGYNNDRWIPASRQDANQPKGSGWPAAGRGHARQKSLGDAIRTIRTRNGSVGQNAQEIADALKAPVSPTLILLCILWYASSAITNTSSKSILNAFDKPATLTLIQFACVSSLCLISAKLASIFPGIQTRITTLKYPIRRPTREVITTTLPLAAFQIGGHLLSSTATSKIPVSLVHTIKGLSPLFTVVAYRVVYDIKYPTATYLSLIPLTLGVMLACSGKTAWGGELIGVIHALLATFIFVTQNIFSKKLFNEAAKAEADGMPSKKMDKLNLLCYSSGLAFVVTLPIWFWSEGIGLIQDMYKDGSVDLTGKPNSMDHGRLMVEFMFNGFTHWAQNILAFTLLSVVSPVTYSVAGLIKRVFVIVITMIWFRSPTTPIQAVGIAFTFLGLYLYDRTNSSSKADRKAQTMAQVSKAPLLPLVATVSSPRSTEFSPRPYNDGYRARGASMDNNSKKTDENGRHTPSGATWLPPGTKQEDTWRASDRLTGTTF